MNWKRVLQVVVCLVLVCAILVGVSPIRANAFLLPGLTDDVVCGILIATIMLSSGFIVEPPDQQFFEDADEALRHFVVDNMYFPGGDSGDGGDDGGDDDDLTPEELSAKLAAETAKLGATVREQVGSGMSGIEPSAMLGTLLGAFIYDCIQNGYFDRQPDEDLSQGYVQFGDLICDPYPVVLEGLPYILVTQNDYNYSNFTVLFTDNPLSVNIMQYGNHEYMAPANTRYAYWSYYSDSIDEESGSHWHCPSSAITDFDSVYTTSGRVWSNPCHEYWSNYSVYDYDDPSVLWIAGSSDYLVSGTDIIEPIAEVGPIVEGIKAGALTAADIPIPEVVDLSSIFEGVETGGLDAVLGNVQSSAQGLASGSLALDDFRESITYKEDDSSTDNEGATDPTEDPSPTEGDDTGTEDDEQGVTDGTLANMPFLNFFARLGQLLQDIFDGNLLGVKNFFEPYLSGIRDDISDVDSSIQQGFQDVVESNQGIMDSVQDVVDSNQQLQDINEQIAQEQNNIISQGFASVAGAVAGGIASAFVPSDGFFEQKIDDLRSEYVFADSIANTAKDMKAFLTNLGSVPPVVYVNLGAATTGYDLGGEVVLVDFSFYEPYKPQMDAILSAFLWLWFCWRVILNLPGIISGASGIVGAFTPSDAGSRGYVQIPSMPSGSVKAGPEKPSVTGWGSPGSTSHYEEWRSRQNK